MKKVKKLLPFIIILLVVIIGIGYFVQLRIAENTKVTVAQKAAAEKVAKERKAEKEGKHESYQEPTSDDIHIIDIEKNEFEPEMLTVKVNEVVAFKNEDTKNHDIASDIEMFRTGPIKPGETLSVVQFPKPGTYTYHDVLQPERKGTIIVTK